MVAPVKHTTDEIVSKCFAIAREVAGLPTHNVWVDFDEEADVLYVSFRKPQRATKTVEIDEDILVRKDGRKVVGVTILNASLHRGAK